MFKKLFDEQNHLPGNVIENFSKSSNVNNNTQQKKFRLLLLKRSGMRQKGFIFTQRVIKNDLKMRSIIIASIH